MRTRHKSQTIPMTIKNGRIIYAKRVPHNYWKDKYTKEFSDVDSCKRKNALENPPLPKKESISRRHLYEWKHDIPPEDETIDERRKREYKEWIEAFI